MVERKQHEELEQLLTPELQKWGRLIDGELPNGWGFGLLVFPFNDNSPAQSVLYVSTAVRDSMIESVETLLEKWKAELDHAKQETA